MAAIGATLSGQAVASDIKAYVRFVVFAPTDLADPANPVCDIRTRPAMIPALEGPPLGARASGRRPPRTARGSPNGAGCQSPPARHSIAPTSTRWRARPRCGPSSSARPARRPSDRPSRRGKLPSSPVAGRKYGAPRAGVIPPGLGPSCNRSGPLPRELCVGPGARGDAARSGSESHG
jgi:hypothetical protein